MIMTMAAIPSMEDAVPTSPKAELVYLTADDASDLLARNVKNRRLADRSVRRLAGAIQRGEWQLNGETIKVCQNGVVLDGQHRLNAIVQANVPDPVPTYIIWGLAPESFKTIDLGKVRTMRDFLERDDEPYSRDLAALLKALFVYRSSGRLSRQPGVEHHASPDQLYELLRDEPGVRESARAAMAIGKKLVRPRTPIALVHYLTSVLAPEDAAVFWQGVLDGSGLIRGDAIYQLRERLLNRTRDGILSNEEIAALSIKAWNYWRTGRHVQMLVWRAGGASPEAFPTPV